MLNGSSEIENNIWTNFQQNVFREIKISRVHYIYTNFDYSCAYYNISPQTIIYTKPSRPTTIFYCRLCSLLLIFEFHSVRVCSFKFSSRTHFQLPFNIAPVRSNFYFILSEVKRSNSRWEIKILLN